MTQLIVALLVINLLMTIYHEWAIKNLLRFVKRLYEWELERTKSL